jgi:hypothetical protein
MKTELAWKRIQIPDKNSASAGHRWLMPIILVTEEAEIKANSGKYFQTPYLKITHQEKGWWSAQGVGPESKPQYHKKKRELSFNHTLV